MVRLKGSIQDVEAVYYAYRKQMYALAFSILQNEMEAEDIVHDVFAKLSARPSMLTKIKTDEDMRNYLLKAAKNTALNRCKQRKRFILFPDSREKPPQDASVLSDDDFLEMVFQRAAYQEVVSAIGRLDQKYEAVLYYHFVLELSVPEVAKTLGRNESTVKKQLVRGKKQLLSILDTGKGGSYV